jgi:hypothetical protein
MQRHQSSIPNLIIALHRTSQVAQLSPADFTCATYKTKLLPPPDHTCSLQPQKRSMSFLARLFSTSTAAATMEAATKKAQQLIDDNAVMVFSKSYCPYCRNSKRILDRSGAKYKTYELNQEGGFHISI